MSAAKRQGRGKTKKIPKKFTVINDARHTWNVVEKKRMVEALKKYGFGDYENIAAHVATRNANEVQLFITNWKQKLTKQIKMKQQQSSNQQKPPIELWQNLNMKLINARYRTTDHLSFLPEVFLSGAVKEKHLAPQDPSDPNFVSIYSYFKEILSGNIPPHLSSVDSLIVLQLLQTLSEIMKNIPLDKEKEFLKEFKPFKDPLYWTSPYDWKHNEDVNLPSTSSTTTEDAMPIPSGTGESDLSVDNILRLRRKHRAIFAQLNPFNIPISILNAENEAILKFIREG